jgi:hypothetical protein
VRVTGDDDPDWPVRIAPDPLDVGVDTGGEPERAVSLRR